MMAKILFLNWKDITHPEAGGAEVFTDALARQTAKHCSVDYFTSAYAGCKQQETIHGYKVIRKGNIYTTMIHAWLFWHTTGQKNNYSHIIDQAHGIPFFARLYHARPAVITIVHEVAGKLWNNAIPIIGRYIGPLIDKLWLLMYTTQKIITVSSSTKQDLVEMGIPPSNISIVPNFSSIQLQNIPEKSSPPTMLVLGRIAPVKRIEHAIQAYRIAKETIPELKLIILGKTDRSYRTYKQSILELIQHDLDIQLIENASESEKIQSLQQCSLLIMASKKEGYGIVILEAAACGTPTIGYRVPGVQDAITHKKTGIIAACEQPRAIAHEIIALLKHPEIYQTMQENAFGDARMHTKEQTNAMFEQFVH